MIDEGHLRSKVRYDPRYPEDQDPCWIWTGTINRNGYGRFKRGMVHVLMWLVYNRPRPKAGEVLDHLCRRRACCNPNHLECVTSRENTLRGEGPSAENARKVYCKRGHRLPEVRNGQGRRACATCVYSRREERGQQALWRT